MNRTALIADTQRLLTAHHQGDEAVDTIAAIFDNFSALAGLRQVYSADGTRIALEDSPVTTVQTSPPPRTRARTYYEQQNIGKCRYVVNYCTGESFHDDGSLFFDIHIFTNKRAKNAFVKQLVSDGYTYR